ncbi:hypothetical protein CUMW_236260 [Citrus unshiu]|nr:hypothetical protein CUMW_236260 [Citrus unshiu]
MDNSRSNIDEKPSLARIQSTVAMESLEERALLELEHESLVNLGSIALSNGSLDVSGGRNAYVTRSCNGVIESIKVVVFSTKLNILIIFGPAAIVVDKTSDANGWVFLLSLLGIIPLAERLGFATEIDDINLCIQKGHDLLVLGSAFFCGALVNAKREGASAVASVNSGLLLMAVMALLFLAVLLATHTELHFEKSKLALSRFCSCAMLVAYAAYLYFQLKSQWQLCDQGASMELKMPVAFISIILLPIVGNAGAIMFTMKDKLVPFSIVIGRIMGRPIDLNLQLFETATLMITEENSNYFKGLMLVFCYVIVAASFLVLEDPTSLRKQLVNSEYFTTRSNVVLRRIRATNMVTRDGSIRLIHRSSGKLRGNGNDILTSPTHHVNNEESVNLTQSSAVRYGLYVLDGS